MTDGILLAETQSDRRLAAYDTLIIDEAHERSLNIDFLLGYLKQLLPQRPDLRVIVTSATIDAQRFAEHFKDMGGPAPIIEVSGRTFPVEVRYRPLGGPDDDQEADDEEALEEGIVAAAEDLWRQGPGDILVFLPGEREIRETAHLLTRGLARRPYAASLEVLPLFARLSVEQQQQVFAPSRGRRIVLATNVAETSLTVPGIRYVIDSGLARVKRYSLRNKVTLLQIEKISQAAANQRAGRCGRLAEGTCVRLYAEADFAARPKYTDPEILRSSLAAVILRMASLDLGDVGAFPFLEKPSPRAIGDGYQLLQELGAVDAERGLTPLGKELARLPVDPRIGRIILAARQARCLADMLVIASALAVPDPRERPLEKQQAADQAHLRFRDERSDFLSLIALWQFFDEALAQKLSHRKLVERCRAHFVSYLRLREWRDLHRQLSEQIAELGWTWDEALPGTVDKVRYEAIHRSLLAGLLSNVGTKADDPRLGADAYLGTRGLKFYLHPGSGLAKKGAKWVLAAELTETTRLYARCAARIEPEWVEAVAGDRVERTFFDPRWDRARGEVIGFERVALYGLTLVARRRVSFGRAQPAAAREVFLREALVAGDFDRRRSAVRVLRRARAGRSPFCGGVRALAQARRARGSAVVVHDAGGADAPRRGRYHRSAVSGRARDGGKTAQARLSVFAGSPARRPHPHRAAVAFESARSDAAVLAGSRNDPGESDLVRQVAAQSLAQPPDAGHGNRHRVPGECAGGHDGVERRIARLPIHAPGRAASGGRLERSRGAAASPAECEDRRRRRRGALERARSRPIARPARRRGPAHVLGRRSGVREERHCPMGLRRFAGDAHHRARRTQAHRLSGARRADRRCRAQAARHARGCRCRDPRRRRPPDAPAAQGRTASLGKGPAGISAGGAAAQALDRQRRPARGCARSDLRPRLHRRRRAAPDGAGVCRADQARPHAAARGSRRLAAPTRVDRRRASRALPKNFRLAARAFAPGRGIARAARRAGVSRLLLRDSLGAACPHSPLLESPRAKTGEICRKSFTGRKTLASGRRIVGSLSSAQRCQSRQAAS
ncbi:MAG: ATP-dependent RNA helicase HrpA [Betaproteobacteria bacterium]|nr:MAG: ATP-dependent RNA helicase HrpA [Betaproteobacteria bacterium]